MIIKVTDNDINAAEEIFLDLQGRGGIGNELDDCDDDIRHEIKVMMAQTIAKHRKDNDDERN